MRLSRRLATLVLLVLWPAILWFSVVGMLTSPAEVGFSGLPAKIHRVMVVAGVVALPLATWWIVARSRAPRGRRT